MKHNFNRKFINMHVSELYEAAKEGDDDALTELIDRQQDGRALRYYPDGRRDAYDEGVVPVQIESKDGLLSIRSGRPSKEIVIDKDTVEEWITGIPECLFHAASTYKATGVPTDEVFGVMTMHSNAEFKVHMIQSEANPDSITITFFPLGEKAWVVSPKDAGAMLRLLLEMCKDLEWTFELDDKEMKSVHALISLDDSTW